MWSAKEKGSVGVAADRGLNFAFFSFFLFPCVCFRSIFSCTITALADVEKSGIDVQEIADWIWGALWPVG